MARGGQLERGKRDVGCPGKMGVAVVAASLSSRERPNAVHTKLPPGRAARISAREVGQRRQQPCKPPQCPWEAPTSPLRRGSRHFWIKAVEMLNPVFSLPNHIHRRGCTTMAPGHAFGLVGRSEGRDLRASRALTAATATAAGRDTPPPACGMAPPSPAAGA